MAANSAQAGLFDTVAGQDPVQAAAARERMCGTIARLRGLAAPGWRDEAAVILEDGAFQRAMRLVPAAEAEALWAAYDAEMERLYSVWAERRGQSRSGP